MEFPAHYLVTREVYHLSLSFNIQRAAAHNKTTRTRAEQVKRVSENAPQVQNTGPRSAAIGPLLDHAL
jgi:hypothetical protein